MPATAGPPLNRETPLALLDRPRTPRADFYGRSNFAVPAIDPATWALRVSGAVARPFEAGLEALRALPRREVAVTMECAGNGRSSLVPPAPGVQWGLGAVSTAAFAGARLRDVLAEAGLAPHAVEVLFSGADAGEVEPGREVRFQRSLPVAAAVDPDVLLAWEMDGAPLPPVHGAPLRLVVPRWYGVASVKWLTEVRALDAPFRGHFQAEKYVYVGEAGTPDGTPVARMRVRAVASHPAEGAVVETGRDVEIRGSAWSGEAPVARVEVSADGGATWMEAALGTGAGPLAAVPWRLAWTPPHPGEHRLLVRAADGAGNEQPLEPVWNALGYGNNAVQRLAVTAR